MGQEQMPKAPNPFGSGSTHRLGFTHGARKQRQLLWDEGYKKMSKDQTLPEMPSFYRNDVRGTVWREAQQAMIDNGFKKVEE